MTNPMTDITLEQRAAMVHAMADVVLESTGETRESVGDITFGWICEVQEKALEAALRLSAGADWQPIETAPKDGTVVMIHERWEDVPIFASWRNGRWYADTSNYDGDAGVYDTICQQNVTHWQPLPAVPRHETGEGES